MIVLLGVIVACLPILTAWSVWQYTQEPTTAVTPADSSPTITWSLETR